MEAVSGGDDAVVRIRGNLYKILVLGNVVVLPSILVLRTRKRGEGGEASGGATDEGVIAIRTAASAGGGERRLESTPNNPCGDILRSITNIAANDVGVGNRQHTAGRNTGCCLERGNGEIFGRGGERKRHERALLQLMPRLVVVFAMAIEEAVEGRRRRYNLVHVVVTGIV